MRAPRERSGTHRSAGVEEHVQTGIEVPQELGRSCHFHEEDTGRGYRETNPRPAAWHSVTAGAKSTGAIVVPPSEGNEVRREGRQEVVVP